MGVLQFLMVTGAYFIYVAAKAMQQLNVVHDYKRLIPAVSVVMAVCDVVVMGNIAVEAVDMDLWGLGLVVVAMVLGGSTGSLVSMALHKRMRKNGGKDG